METSGLAALGGLVMVFIIQRISFRGSSNRQLAADAFVHRCDYGPTLSALILQRWLS
jgi:hypothetical protein